MVSITGRVVYFSHVFEHSLAPLCNKVDVAFLLQFLLFNETMPDQMIQELFQVITVHISIVYDVSQL